MAATPYHRQIKACSKYFDVDPRDLPYVYEIDITGWDAHKVVRLLKSIVNKQDYRDRTSVFEFKIKPPDQHSAPSFFRLHPNSTDSGSQPGNGLISYLQVRVDTNTTIKTQHGYRDLNDLLTKTYLSKETGEEETHRFALDIEKVFRDNSEIYNVPSATAEAYMILLLEIGRRLVNGSTWITTNYRLQVL